MIRLGGFGDDNHELARGGISRSCPGTPWVRWGCRSTAPTAVPSSVATPCTARRKSSSQASRLRPASIQAAPPRPGESCSTKPRRPAGWWCRRTSAGGARPAARAAPHKQRPRLNIACGTVSSAADRSSVDTFPYSGVIAVTSVSTIISGKASAATPIRVWTGKGAAPKFLARHWPYGTRFFMSVR